MLLPPCRRFFFFRFHTPPVRQRRHMRRRFVDAAICRATALMIRALRAAAYYYARCHELMNTAAHFSPFSRLFRLITIFTPTPRCHGAAALLMFSPCERFFADAIMLSLLMVDSHAAGARPDSIMPCCHAERAARSAIALRHAPCFAADEPPRCRDYLRDGAIDMLI